MLAITPDPTGHFTRAGYNLQTVKLAAGYVPAFLQDGKSFMDCLHGHFKRKRMMDWAYTPLLKELIIHGKKWLPLVEAISNEEVLLIYGDYCIHIRSDYQHAVLYAIQPTEATMKLQLRV